MSREMMSTGEGVLPDAAVRVRTTADLPIICMLGLVTNVEYP